MTPLPPVIDQEEQVALGVVPEQIPAAEPAPEAAGPRLWKVGTLTYTTAGLVTLFFWLLFGDFAWSMRDRSVGPMSQWYLNQLKVPNLVFGLLISSFPALIGLVLGPIISVKSDRHRGRWGRRIPFLLVTTPVAATGMVGLAVTPILAQWLHGFAPTSDPRVTAVICFGVFWAAFEIATIASQAVFGGLINDVVPKELIGRFYGLFRAVSLIDGMIFNYWIYGKIPTHFTLILTSIGVFYGAAFLFVCLKVKEGNYPPPPPSAPKRQGDRLAALAGARAYFKESFNNPYYIWLFILMMAAGSAFAPVNIYAIPYSESLGIPEDVYGKCLTITFAISLGLSYFLGWLADLLHPLRLALITVLGYAAVTVFGWFFVNSATTFLVAWVMHGVLSGCYYTSAASLGQRLFPQSRFAQFASAAGMVGAPMGIALAPLVGALIDATEKTYRHTFAIGACLSVLALIAGWQVYRRFMALGGPKNYIAP